MINKRISDLSCNKEKFDKVKFVYESTLNYNGHFYAQRNRNRKVIWFNPPHSQNVKTNIGKLFIRFVRKHFPKKNKYDKIFNLSPLKLSYCSTINVGNIIKQHNSKVLSKANDNNNRKCNCKLKPKFPLIGECLTQCLVYQATARTSSNSFVKGSSKHGITTVQNLSDTVNT